jgi:hypothetical protein
VRVIAEAPTLDAVNRLVAQSRAPVDALFAS